MKSLFFSTLCILAVAGCSSIVKKPEIGQVKKVAILSLYANDKIVEESGLGIAQNWPAEFKMQVAEKALQAHKRELNKLGWEVVSEKDVVQSESYQAAFRDEVKSQQADPKPKRLLALAQNLHNNNYFTPAGMFPIEFSDKAANTTYYGDQSRNPKAKLAELAKSLNVDAVLVVQMDYCYKGGTWSMLGTGEAVMTAASSIKAINHEGKLVINMPALQTCGGQTRVQSDSSTAMHKGNLTFKRNSSKKLGKMLFEATSKATQQTIAELKEEMG